MKKVIAVLLCMFMTLNVSGYAFSAEAGDEVTFIIELVGGGELERKLNNEEEATAERKIEEIQIATIDSIEKITGHKVIFRYSEVLNGFAIRGKESDIDKLKAVPNVLDVYISNEIIIDDPESDDKTYEIDSDMTQTGFSLFSDNSTEKEYTGKGQVIAILDTELNFNHVFFSNTPTDAKYTKSDIQALIAGEDLQAEKIVANFSANDVYKSAKLPFVFDYGDGDCNPNTTDENNNHGTHVAGITALKARDAQVFFMKVRSDGASVSFDLVLAAIEDSIKLGADVINLSLGSVCGFSQDDFYQKMSYILEKSGVCISAASGNSGIDSKEKTTQTAPSVEHTDYGTIAFPSLYECSNAIAAAQTGYDYKNFMVGDTKVSYVDATRTIMFEDFDDIIGTGEHYYEYCGYGYDEDFDGLDVNGKIALIDRGEITFEEKVRNAKKHGAIAVIFVNTADEAFYMFIQNIPFPCAEVYPSAGQILKNYPEKKLIILDESQKKIASYSGYGCTPDLKLKPDIIQNGTDIVSSVHGSNTLLGTKSGTSMAAPIYASEIANVNEYLEEIKPGISKPERKELAERLLQTSAEIIYENGIPSSPRGQGAGYGSDKKAVQISTVLKGTDDKTKVELGDKIDNKFSFTIKAENITNEEVTYSLNTLVTSDWCKTENNMKLVSGRYLWDDAEVEYFVDDEECEEITIPANSEKEIDVRVTLDEQSINEVSSVFTNGFFVEGYVTLENANEPLLSIPFMGYRGNWLDDPIFNTSEYGYGNGSCIMYKTGTISPYDEKTNTYFLRPRYGNVISFYPDNNRNIKQITLDIYDSNSNLLKHATASNISKNLSDPSKLASAKKVLKTPQGFDFPLYEGKKLSPDGYYTYQISAYVDYEGAENAPQTLTYNMYFDTVSPTLEDAYIISNTLYIKPSDASNTGFSYLMNGKSKIESIETTLDGYNTFNIEGIDLSNCTAVLTDIVENKTEYSFSFGNGYHAEYTDNRLSEVSRFNAIMLNSKLLNAPTTTQNGKIFVWDDAMKPITFN